MWNLNDGWVCGSSENCGVSDFLEIWRWDQGRVLRWGGGWDGLGLGFWVIWVILFGLGGIEMK